MTKIKRLSYDFLLQLKENKTSSPNDLTIGMGKLIKKAREELGISQKELAGKISSKQSTISDIEKGKNEIGILMLSVLSLTLRKPISYFFPEGSGKDLIVDVTNADQQKALNLFREIEFYGGGKLALKQLDGLLDHFLDVENMQTSNTDNFPTDEEISESNSDEYEV